jgi:hypothetical protein
MMLDGCEFYCDRGEMDVDKDDEFHVWDDCVDGDCHPPKIDAHASDSTTVTMVQVFSPTADFGNMSEIKERESCDLSVDLRRKVNTLTMKAVDNFEGSASISKKSKSKPFDTKSATSKMSSMVKLKFKAQNHLMVTREEIKKIVQVPLNESEMLDSNREIIYKDAKGKTRKVRMDPKKFGREEDDEKVIMLRDMLIIQVSFCTLNYRKKQENVLKHIVNLRKNKWKKSDVRLSLK